VREAWPVLEPATPLVEGWHLDAITDHLEAVSRGEIRQLVINIPPRFGKSLSVAVFWPVWEWLRSPGTQWIYASYAATLSRRDSRRCRDLITSAWFQSRWGDRLRLTMEQADRLETSERGYRLATSVGGFATGEGGHRVVIDDAHNVMDAVLSHVDRERAWTWATETMSSRYSGDPAARGWVLIGQRIHEMDLPGRWLDERDGNVHLCLPNEYEGPKCSVEKRHACSLQSETPLGFKDPRQTDGELLWPNRVTAEFSREQESALGEIGYAAQYQQRPVPRGGGLFKVERFEIVSAIPGELSQVWRSWDKAGTEGGGARTAGVKMGRLADGRSIVLDVVKGQWSALTREQTIRQTAEIDGVGVRILLEAEGGSGGKESAEASVRNLAGFVVETEHPTGSKEERATPFAVQVEAGNVLLLRGDWNRDFVEELRSFPSGRYKDQADAAAAAFNRLFAPRKGVTGVGRMRL
jgi:predicted phage terminase large subunit-like protein